MAAVIFEEWRSVVGWEGLYEVSSIGRVRSLPRYKAPGGLLAAGIHPSGRRVVTLQEKTRKRREARVHVLVAEAFIGPRPSGYEIRHLDGDRLNNLLSNLAYGTPSENSQDSLRHGTHAVAARTHCKQGHSYADPGVVRWRRYPKGSGWRRYCAICQLEFKRRWRARGEASP